MKLNEFEIANVLIAASLIILLSRKRDVLTLLLVLFAYGTLHFSFAALVLATNEAANLLIELHTIGGGMLAKISTLALLGTAFVMLSLLAYDKWVQDQTTGRGIVRNILLAMGILFCGYLLNFRYGDWLQLKNVISMEALLGLLIVGFLGGRSERTLNDSTIHLWILGGLLILCATDCIAIYEVFMQRTWAGTLESSGEMVYRASSILFNPNLLAFWASLVYLGCAYGMHESKEYRGAMLWGMVMAAVAIYFSGSRSAGYLLLATLFVSSILHKNRFRWIPLLTLLLTMLTIYLGAVLYASCLEPRAGGWHEIILLGNRFASAPVHLVNYILMLVDTSFHVPAGVPAGVPAEVVEAIKGRFVGEGRDAGWLVLYQDAGWLGMLSMLSVSAVSLWLGLRTYIATRSAASVYALATLCCCLMIGFVMRFQIFPVWIFIGVMLIPCLVFWTRVVETRL